MGFLGGVNVQGKGSSLVETDIGLARHTTMLIDPAVDVKRNVQNAAYMASSMDASIIMGTTAAMAVGMFAAEFISFNLKLTGLENITDKANAKVVVFVSYTATRSSDVQST